MTQLLPAVMLLHTSSDIVCADYSIIWVTHSRESCIRNLWKFLHQKFDARSYKFLAQKTWLTLNTIAMPAENTADQSDTSFGHMHGNLLCQIELRSIQCRKRVCLQEENAQECMTHAQETCASFSATGFLSVCRHLSENWYSSRPQCDMSKGSGWMLFRDPIYKISYDEISLRIIVRQC